jgi:murein DD-endopeptidase MepM/ murein hydrolase activator NlpD
MEQLITKFKYLLIFSVLITGTTCLSASLKGKKLVKKLRNDLVVQKSKVTTLTASIRSIENEIGKKNSSYLRRLEQLQKLDVIKDEMNSELLHNQKIASLEQLRVNQILSKLVGTSLDENLQQVYEKTVLKAIISAQMQKLKSYKKNNLQIRTQLIKLNKKMENVHSFEKDLYSVIMNMESKKGLLAQKYLEEVGNREKIENYLSREQLELASKKMAKKGHTKDFLPPISNYLSYKMERKGLTFYYNKARPVAASKAGIVVYAGKLASYGDVLMIDHGKQLRTVVLGRLKIRVKKGQKVKRSQVIAYTENPRKKDGLYFEIRKKNKAQKVLSYLRFNKKKKEKLIKI